MKISLLVTVVLSCVFFSACNPDDTEGPGKPGLDLTVDVSLLSSAERQSIDSVRVEVAGSVPSMQLQESASFAADSLYVISSDPIEIKEPTDVFVRMSVYAGDFEVAGQTQVITLTNKNSIEKTFKLTSRVSPNGCKFVRTPQPVDFVAADANIGSFDVVAVNNMAYLLAYSQLSGKSGDINTIMLDSQFRALGQPSRITGTAQKSVSPMLAKMLDGYALLWQFVIGDYGVNGFDVTKLNPSGQILSGSMVIQASKAEIYPALAVVGSTVAVGWQEVAPGGFNDQMMIARLSHTTTGVSGLIDDKKVGTKTAKHFALTPNGSGFAGVWSDSGNVNFSFFDANFNPSGQMPLRSSQGEALHSSIVALSSGFMATWEDTRGGSSEIYTSTVSQAGAKLSEQKVIDAAAFNPRLVTSGLGTALAFTQTRDASTGGAQFFLTLLNPNGTRMGSGDLQISTALDRNVVNPRILSTPLGYLLSWIEEKAGAPGVLKFAQVQCL